MNAKTCEGCGQTVTQWTIAKGFVLLCDRCLLRRLNRSNDLEDKR